jgi:hypothetical protein
MRHSVNCLEATIVALVTALKPSVVPEAGSGSVMGRCSGISTFRCAGTMVRRTHVPRGCRMLWGDWSWLIKGMLRIGSAVMGSAQWAGQPSAGSDGAANGPMSQLVVGVGPRDPMGDTGRNTPPRLNVRVLANRPCSIPPTSEPSTLPRSTRSGGPQGESVTVGCSGRKGPGVLRWVTAGARARWISGGSQRAQARWNSQRVLGPGRDLRSAGCVGPGSSHQWQPLSRSMRRDASQRKLPGSYDSSTGYRSETICSARGRLGIGYGPM